MRQYVRRMTKVVVAVIALSVLGACSNAGQDTSKPTPAPSASATDKVAVYITKRRDPSQGPSVDGGVDVTKPADLAKLRGATPDFIAFIRQELAKDTKLTARDLAKNHTSREKEGCDSLVDLAVWGATPNVATGAVWECANGGYESIWARRDGRWREVAGSQEGWPCAELRKYRVPAEITAATCLSKPSSWDQEPYYGPKY